jgi:voltage-gated potassium channel
MGSGFTELFNGTPAEDVVSRRLIVVALARVLGIVAVTLLAYFVIPIEGANAARSAVVAASVGIATILAVFARQMSRVSRSQRPALAAVEALVLVFGLFLCFFALLYVALSAGDPGAFTQGVNKVAGIYFTMTILTTVGFGDISAVSDTARVMVTLQMVLGVILIGTAVKALAFSATRAVAERTDTIASGPREGPTPGGTPAGTRHDSAGT